MLNEQPEISNKETTAQKTGTFLSKRNSNITLTQDSQRSLLEFIKPYPLDKFQAEKETETKCYENNFCIIELSYLNPLTAMGPDAIACGGKTPCN